MRFVLKSSKYCDGKLYQQLLHVSKEVEYEFTEDLNKGHY